VLAFIKKHLAQSVPAEVPKTRSISLPFVPVGTSLDRELLTLLNQLSVLPQAHIKTALDVFARLSMLRMAQNIVPTPAGEPYDVLRVDEAPIYVIEALHDLLANLDRDREALAEALKKQEEQLNG
jgi:hypothetical protein